MKLCKYNQIVEKYREMKKRDCLKELATFFPDIPLRTLESIVFQEVQRKTKKTYHYHGAPHRIDQYYERYLEEASNSFKVYGFLLRMADEVDLSPALMAKFILERHYNEDFRHENSEEEVEKVPKAKVSEMLRNSFLIDDRDLATEVRLCVLYDEDYGNISDVIKNTVGQEYETKLKDELRAKGFPFLDEKQLREKGYDKTPDVKLDIPIAVDGQVINWIESKASFGDEDRHKEYLKDQYWCYCNRFGPGLVIYWAGFIEELNINQEQGILISDSLPSQVTHMDPSLLVKNRYKI